MYLGHFGLRKFPFRITPDPDFLFWTADHHRAFALLTRVVRGERPIATILGEPGTGKTTLLRHFVASQPKHIRVGMMSTYSSGSGELGYWLHRAFDLCPEGPEEKLLTGFEAYLVERHNEGVRCLLIVDEAQNIADDDIAALTGLVERPGASLQLAFAGQPGLHRSLRATRPEGKGDDFALLQIGAMSVEDVSGYIRHRMAFSGCASPVFDDEAIECIAQLSLGVPRLVNVLCELLLISAFHAGERKIDLPLVDRVLQYVRQTGMIDHLFPPSGRLASGVGRVRPIRTKSGTSPLGAAAAGVGSLGFLVQDAEPNPRRHPAEIEGPKPTDPSTLSGASEDTTVAHSRTNRRGEGRGGLTFIAAGSAAAAAVLVMLLPTLIEPNPIIAKLPQDNAPGAQAPTASAARQVHVGPALPIPAALQGSDAATLRNQALSIGAQDPLTAAIGFARAALRGDTRAAYYLGQHLEVGDGVPRNATLAAAWYAAAAETQRSARHALENLSKTPVVTGRSPSVPPRQLMGVIADDGSAEFIWAAADDTPMRYLIEVAEEPDVQPQQYGPFDLSGAMLDLTASARIWRIVSVNDQGAETVASGWRLVATDEDRTSAEAAGLQHP